MCIVKLYIQVVVDVHKQEFSERLSSLRLKKGVSARDMSLSIGQSAGYINNIENGINYPSMQTFFYICDYLEITPKEFFDKGTANPNKVNELMDAVKGLNDEQLNNIIGLARGLK